MMPYNTPFFRNKARLWLLIAGLLALTILAIAIPMTMAHPSMNSRNEVQSGSFPGTGPQRFSVRPNALLIVKEQSGNISVFPTATNTITIEPRTHGTLAAPDPHNVRILSSQTVNAQGNDQLTVTTDPWFSNTDFSITIPQTAVVQITVNSGSIDVHSGHGLDASTGSGSIALDNIQGPTHVSTDSGDVTANTITGPLTIEAQSGSIRLRQIKGQVNAMTASGDVIARASDLSGQSTLQTQSGSVRFDGSIDPNGSYRLQTNSGDVTATLPANTTFTLDAGTNSGTVQNAFGANVVGNTPRAQLSMHTQSGSITVAKGLRGFNLKREGRL